jgi:geranylgeranyl diphosphate synthase, type II
MKVYDHFSEIINTRLHELSISPSPENLYQPVKYILSLGGKRLRPVLALAGCDLFDASVEKAVNFALGIEIFHNFTLLHDDIMDKAPLRRGHATVHEKWDTNVAILSGDTMFALAYQQMLKTANTNLYLILQSFTETAIEVCEGQQLDMDFEKLKQVSTGDYINMVRLKTAVLLGCSLKIGALAGGAAIQQANLLYDFGVNVGIAFQLKDDYLDAFGNPEKFGKNVGGDIIENKKTCLYIKCMELANEEDAKTLQRLYSGQNTGNTNKIEKVLSIFNKYHIREAITEQMEMYFGKSIQIFEQVVAPKDKKEQLLHYARWLYERDH